MLVGPAIAAVLPEVAGGLQAATGLVEGAVEHAVEGAVQGASALTGGASPLSNVIPKANDILGIANPLLQGIQAPGQV